MAVLAITSVFFTLDLPKVDNTEFYAKFKRIDFLGALTLVFSTFTLLLGLDRGGNVAWDDKVTIGCLIAFVVLFLVFLFVEMEFAKEPFAPKHILTDRSLLASYWCNFFMMAANTAFVYHASLYFQAVEGMSAGQAGLRLIAPVIAATTGSLCGGLIMQSTGKYYVLTLFAFTFGFGGTILASLSTDILFHSNVAVVCGMSSLLVLLSTLISALGLTMMAFGVGVGITTTLISLIANAGSQDQAVATAGK